MSGEEWDDSKIEAARTAINQMIFSNSKKPEIISKLKDTIASYGKIAVLTALFDVEVASVKDPNSKANDNFGTILHSFAQHFSEEDLKVRQSLAAIARECNITLITPHSMTPAFESSSTGGGVVSPKEPEADQNNNVPTPTVKTKPP